MCGLFYVFRKDGGISQPDEERYQSAVESLEKRGPDNTSYTCTARQFFGHTRLRIVDTNVAADQPFVRSEGILVFNGEITNHRQIRGMLSTKYDFQTSSDTEALYWGLKEWGQDVTRHIQGMYSFVFWDKKENKTIFCRDELGIKPLYIYEDKESIVLSSTIVAIEHYAESLTIEEKGVYEYFMHGFTASKTTFYREIERVPPGKLGRIDQRDGKVEIGSDEGYMKRAEGKEPEWDKLAESIEGTIQEWLDMDCSYMLALSGGLDSTLIAAIASGCNRKTSAITLGDMDIGLNSMYEASQARKSADVLGLNLAFCQPTISHESVSALIKDMDEPPGGFNIFSAIAMAEEMKRTDQNCRVLITGEGADEIFGGYERYFCEESERKCEAMGLRYGTYGRNYLSFSDFTQLTGRKYKATEYREKITDKALTETDDRVNMLLYIEQSTFIRSRLTALDQVCTLMGIEIRPPFVDRRIAAMANKMPSQKKTVKDSVKYGLRIAFQEMLPSYLQMNSYKKAKLPDPAQSMIDGDTMRNYLLEQESLEVLDTYFERANLVRFLQVALKNNRKTSLTRLYTLCIWLRARAHRRMATC